MLSLTAVVNNSCPKFAHLIASPKTVLTLDLRSYLETLIWFMLVASTVVRRDWWRVKPVCHKQGASAVCTSVYVCVCMHAVGEMHLLWWGKHRKLKKETKKRLQLSGSPWETTCFCWKKLNRLEVPIRLSLTLVMPIKGRSRSWTLTAVLMASDTTKWNHMNENRKLLTPPSVIFFFFASFFLRGASSAIKLSPHCRTMTGCTNPWGRRSVADPSCEGRGLRVAL